MQSYSLRKGLPPPTEDEIERRLRVFNMNPAKAG